MKNFGKEELLDKVFRQKLKDHEMTGTDHLWKGIESRLEDKKRITIGSGLSWKKWFVIFSLIFVGGFAAYKLQSISNTKKNKTIENEQNVMRKNNGIAQDNNKINESTQVNENSKLSSGENEIGKEGSVSDISFQPTQENTGVVAETKAMHSKEGIASNSKKDLGGDKVYSKTRKHRNNTRQFIENQSDIISTSKFNSTIVNTIEPNTAGSLQNESGSNALLSVPLSENTEDNSISKATTLLGSVVSSTTKMPKKIKKYEYEDDGCNIFKNDRKRYYLDLYYSPELTSKSITAKNPVHQKYADLRTSDEKFAVSYSMGVRGSVVFRNGLALRSGLMYSVIKENFDWDSGDETNTKIVFNPLTGKNDTTTIISDIISRSNNSYKFFDIPFYVGYEKELRDFVFSANAGLGFNLSSRQSGIIYENENKTYYKLGNGTDAVSNIYKQNVGVSALFNFGLNYRINQRFRLLIEPSFRYYLSGLTTKDHILKHNTLQSGVILGVRYKLF